MRISRAPLYFYLYLSFVSLFYFCIRFISHPDLYHIDRFNSEFCFFPFAKSSREGTNRIVTPAKLLDQNAYERAEHGRHYNRDSIPRTYLRRKIEIKNSKKSRLANTPMGSSMPRITRNRENPLNPAQLRNLSDV